MKILIPWKDKHLGADIHGPNARCGGRPWPQEVQQKLRAEKLRADFSFPSIPHIVCQLSTMLETFRGATEACQPDLPLWPRAPPNTYIPPRPDPDLILTWFGPEKRISGPNRVKIRWRSGPHQVWGGEVFGGGQGQRLSGPNRAMPPWFAMRFESRTPKSISEMFYH